MNSRVAALVVTLLVLFLLIFSSYQLGTRLTALQFFQLESKLIYIILSALALGALVMFVIVSYFPPSLPSRFIKKPAEATRDPLRAGEAAYQLGDLETAEALLTTIEPDNANFWYAKKIIGDAELRKNHPAAAENHYQESLRLASGASRALPLLSLAVLYDEQGQPDRATDLYREVIKLAPQSLEALIRLRDRAMKDQEWTDALSWQEQIEERFPKASHSDEDKQARIGIRYELAQLQFQQGAYKTAQALLKYILRVTDSFVPAYLLLGEIHRRLEHSSSALKMWEAGFAATENAVFLERIAECFLTEGAPEAAIEHVRNVVRNNPDNPTLQFCLANLYLKMEMVHEAQAVLENITKKNPDWLLSRSTLAELYLRTGQAEKATPILTRLFAAGTLPSVLQWECYNCSTNFFTYHALCLECMEWNTINFNRQKAGSMVRNYRESTAFPV